MTHERERDSQRETEGALGEKRGLNHVSLDPVPRPRW